MVNNDPELINNSLEMRRCFDLARLGKGKVNPNPTVGSILLNNNMIIGEGYHQHFGGKHAEVNCFESVLTKNIPKIPNSTLFVSLEPCCFKGKTPACSDLIIKHKVKDLRISTIDKTPKVNGKGLKILSNNNVKIKTKYLEETGDWFVRNRTVFVTKKRPYVILKYAVSKDGYIGQVDKKIWLTNSISKRLVHKWRSEVGAIMVGTNTALTDNPRLDNRYYIGKSPLRIVPDLHDKIPSNAHLKDGKTPTWILRNKDILPTDSVNLKYIPIPTGDAFLPSLFGHLVEANIDTLLVEGGAKLLESFIKSGFWDEARVFETNHTLGHGIPAPRINGQNKVVEWIGEDRLTFIYPNH